MRLLVCALTLSGLTLLSGCVVVGAGGPAVGFYGPFPAVYVPGHPGYDGDDHYRSDREEYGRGGRREYERQH